MSDRYKLAGSFLPLTPLWELDKRPPTGFALNGTPKFQGKNRGRLIFQGVKQEDYDSILTLMSNTTTSISTTITVPNEAGTMTQYTCIALRPTWERVWQLQGIREQVVVEVIELTEVS